MTEIRPFKTKKNLNFFFNNKVFIHFLFDVYQTRWNAYDATNSKFDILTGYIFKVTKELILKRDEKHDVIEC